ncbi:uncharacterized protein BO97DRAFT_388626 [Aspergillus homomorphus CBS 101889]|uniref:Acetamidase n=1 Tax=Aspergillus homomorphus (strain CBS 101889) TaxID=1450537 RepID=A0A395I1A9_ASPHC|nr:hypothetical protein BO97DRAFT_388626 [Aspergillus homomorphus CBS 101889]RAL13469.1 hypothetical protein BO97DRAFT_388626 [Aspergillus homomorphus CBS 101889]
MPDSEVLIHIAAPSTVRDDARYRAQVEAILAFQASTRQMITLRSDKDPEESPGADDASTASSAQPAASPTAVDSTASTASVAATVGDQALDGSTPDIPSLQPEAAQALTKVSSPSGRTQYDDSLGTPISVVPDSQPGQGQPGTLALQEIEPPVTATCRSHERAPPTDYVRTAKRSREDHPVHEHENPPQPCLDVPSSPDTHRHDTPSTRDTLVTTPLKIIPPLPPVSTSPFKTHITPTLSMLATRLRSERTYTPVRQTRDLDPLERGYWFLHINLVPSEPPPPSRAAAHSNPAISTTTWGVSFFTRFWTFLSDFLKEGRAGWGVWCIVEDAQPTPPPAVKPGQSTTHPPADAEMQRLTLKVYTWGEVASHIYLLLFLASERRIRRMGAQWRDGGDKVVIEMP